MIHLDIKTIDEYFEDSHNLRIDTFKSTFYRDIEPIVNCKNWQDVTFEYNPKNLKFKLIKDNDILHNLYDKIEGTMLGDRNFYSDFINPNQQYKPNYGYIE